MLLTPLVITSSQETSSTGAASGVTCKLSCHAMKSLQLQRAFSCGSGTPIWDLSLGWRLTLRTLLLTQNMVESNRDCLLGMCRASAQRLLDERRKAFYMCLAYAKVLSAAATCNAANGVGNLHIGSHSFWPNIDALALSNMVLTMHTSGILALIGSALFT